MKAIFFTLTVCITLIGCMLVSGHDPEPMITPSTVDHGDSSELSSATSYSNDQTQQGSYFGVDPNDLEAVRKVQQELSHEKFKELFGDDVNIEDFNLVAHSDDSSDGDASEKRLSLVERLTKLFDLFKPATKED